MKIERIWAMPHRWTFTIKPIKELLKEELTYPYGRQFGIDPFAGKNSPALYTNDIKQEIGAKSCMDALEYLKGYQPNHFDYGLYDPPYSITQARMYGKKIFSSMKYWADVKTELGRVLKPGGKAICFGWSSMGLGKSRGFKMTRILLVPHGGSKNDTLVTVETKDES